MTAADDLTAAVQPKAAVITAGDWLGIALARVGLFRQAVPPGFDEASDPERIATSRAGDYTNRPSSLVEWLASRDHEAQIGMYVHRYMARKPGAQQWYETGRTKGEAGLSHAEIQGEDMAEELGWSVAKLTLSP